MTNLAFSALQLVYIPGTAGITAYGAANPDIFGAGGTYQFHQAVGFFVRLHCSTCVWVTID